MGTDTGTYTETQTRGHTQRPET
uniref:Uncharacterized protein n=1 Tax=Anguilla anguilla TaxID=7936 RepID=A0A0E9SR74_ANGAN